MEKENMRIEKVEVMKYLRRQFIRKTLALGALTIVPSHFIFGGTDAKGEKKQLIPPLMGYSSKGVSYDIIIENGKIIDGTGNPWYYGDLGVINDKIMKIGCLKESLAKRRIDAKGMFISPGFIDMHTHSDFTILGIPTADNSVRQGLTTIVGGNCGFSLLPVDSFLDKVRNVNSSINYIHLVGHNSVREKVMGSENRAPTENELSEMTHIVEESMKAGAFGLSTGLYYTPGNYAETKEIVELARVVARYGGIYASHIRDESNHGAGLFGAINEAISIGEEANIPVQISHLKCLGEPVWHKSDKVLELITMARRNGVNIMFDQYPYTANSTSLWNFIIPAWAKEGGSSAFFKKLEDPEVREKIKNEMWEIIKCMGGADHFLVRKENAYLSELAKTWNLDAVDAAIRIEKEGGSSIVVFSMADYDVENFIRSPYGMVGSDGWITNTKNHPREFGTFPRVLGIYVREKKLLTIEEAIRKMTSAPANQLGLRERGIIREGMIADLVVFNPETVIDMATYDNPCQYPEGIHYVIINGIIVIDNKKHTGAHAGKVLSHFHYPD